MPFTSACNRRSSTEPLRHSSSAFLSAPAEPVPAEPLPAESVLVEPVPAEPGPPAEPPPPLAPAHSAEPVTVQIDVSPLQDRRPQALPPQALPPQELLAHGEITRDDIPVIEEPPSWEQALPPQPGERRPDVEPPRPPAWTNDRAMALGTTREGRAPQLPGASGGEPAPGPYGELAVSPAAGQPPGPEARNMSQPRRGRVTVSGLLTELGMAGPDRETAESCLRAIGQLGPLDDPEERRAAWRIIADVNWCTSVCQNALHPSQLAPLFSVVVIPDLRETGAAEKVGRWALKVPPPMIGALLAAARMSGPDTWQAVMSFLEPFLALRLVSETYIKDQWDTERASRLAAEFSQGANAKASSRNPFRRR